MSKKRQYPRKSATTPPNPPRMQRTGLPAWKMRLADSKMSLSDAELSTTPDSPPLRNELADMPRANMSTITQEESTSMAGRPPTSMTPEAIRKREKRAAARQRPEADTGTTEKSTTSSTTDVAPDGLATEQQPVELTPREKKLVKNLTGLYMGVGGIVAGFRALPGQIIMGSADARADEVVRWARHDKKVMENLEKFCAGNDTFNMILGHGAMLFAILVSVDRIALGPRTAALLEATGYKGLIQVKMQEKAEAADVAEAAAA